MSNKRVWLGYAFAQVGEREEADYMIIETHDGKPPTDLQLEQEAFEWQGYDWDEDHESLTKDGGGWWRNDDALFYPIELTRELSLVEAEIWDIAHNLRWKPFELNDFMRLAELEGDDEKTE